MQNEFQCDLTIKSYHIDGMINTFNNRFGVYHI